MRHAVSIAPVLIRNWSFVNCVRLPRFTCSLAALVGLALFWYRFDTPRRRRPSLSLAVAFPRGCSLFAVRPFPLWERLGHRKFRSSYASIPTRSQIFSFRSSASE